MSNLSLGLTRTKHSFNLSGNSPLLLDLYSGAVAAHSINRRLKTTYLGPLFRVRRSSDNSEIDINFTGANVVDVAALTAFVGANNGFITRIYDQSGLSNDVINTLGANQPLIVGSGTLQTRNSKLAAYFNGSKDLVRNAPLISAFPFSHFVVATDNSAFFPVGGSEDTSTNFLYWTTIVNNVSVGATLREVDGTTTRNLDAGSYNNGVLRNVAAHHINTTNKTLTVDGTTVNSTTFANSPFPVKNYSIGSIARPAKVYGLGWFCEAILFGNNQTSNSSAIQLDLKTYYGTP